MAGRGTLHGMPRGESNQCDQKQNLVKININQSLRGIIGRSGQKFLWVECVASV